MTSFLSESPVDPSTYGLFLLVMATLAVTPGPANLFAIATGMAEGPRAALMGVLGMNTATLVWFAAAALGLGALVAAFPAAFHLIALLGGVYVLWLGARALWASARPPSEAEAQAAAPLKGSAFLRGFGVQIANPKAVLFFTAILPPFLDPTRPAAAQLAAFATGTLMLDLAAMGAYGLAGGALSFRMQDRRFRRGFNLIVGFLLVTAAGLILTRS
jgi:threonine/homoserine/homoserine lactone efflux protein